MAEVVVNPSLSPIPKRQVAPGASLVITVPGIEMVAVQGPRGPQRKQRERDIVRHDLPADSDDVVFHQGWFQYLDACYNQHLGVVVSPEVLWHVVLCELAEHVKAKAKDYTALFTRASGKTEILVYGDAEVAINPESFVDVLREHVPVSPDLFLPAFSTATHRSNAAHAAAFMDAVSPYYDYSMMMCGISRVRVEGTVADWDKFLSHMDSLAALLDKATGWFTRVRPHVEKIRAAAAGEVDLAFWKDIFHVERCGSGHQVEVIGWARDFAMKRPRPAYVQNFPTHVAKVTAKQVETGREYAYCTGILYSRVTGEYLVPDFGYVVERLAQDATVPAEGRALTR